jgi:hypothetical protein
MIPWNTQRGINTHLRREEHINSSAILPQALEEHDLT